MVTSIFFIFPTGVNVLKNVCHVTDSPNKEIQAIVAGEICHPSSICMSQAGQKLPKWSTLISNLRRHDALHYSKKCCAKYCQGSLAEGKAQYS